MYDLNCLLRYLLSKSKKHTASILLAGTKEGTKTVPLEPFCNFRMQQISYLEELSQPRKCQRKHKLSCSFMCLTNINQPNIAIQQMLPSMLGVTAPFNGQMHFSRPSIKCSSFTVSLSELCSTI